MSEQSLLSRRFEDWRYVDVDLINGHEKGSSSVWSGDMPDLPMAEVETCLISNDQVVSSGSENLSPVKKENLDSSELEALSSYLKDSQGRDAIADRHFEGGDLHFRLPVNSTSPLQWVSLHSGKGSESRSRVHLWISDASELALSLVSAGTGEAYLANVEWVLHIGESAKVDVQLASMDGGDSIYLGGVSGILQKNARLNLQFLGAPSRCVRQRYWMDIVGEGADASLSGTGVVDGEETLHHHVVVNHKVGGSHSSQHFKTVLRDKSRSSFDGTIEVSKGADGTDAEQLNRFLMISDQARASAKPQLKIYADDVACAHGATLGELEEDELFYLQSRGLDEAVSKSLLTRGFIAEVLDQSPIPEATQWWQTSVFLPRFKIDG
jgi:Fe-S cluster assembly protein SufD